MAARGDLKCDAVPCALPLEALPAPCRVAGDVAGDDDGLRPHPRRDSDRLGDRVAVPDHQVSAEFPQLLPEGRDRVGKEPRPVRRHGKRRIGDEKRHHRAGVGTRARQRGVVAHPQVPGEQHDGDVHGSLSFAGTSIIAPSAARGRLSGALASWSCPVLVPRRYERDGGERRQGDEGEGHREPDGGDERADAGADDGGGDELAGVLDAECLARPGGPAASATEVNDRPLSATLTVEAMTSTIAEATAQCSAPAAARASMTATPETADPAQHPHAAADPVARGSRQDAAEGADELGDRDDRASRGGAPAKAGDQPDHAEGGQRELRHHQQRGQQVDAGEEQAVPVRVVRPLGVAGAPGGRDGRGGLAMPIAQPTASTASSPPVTSSGARRFRRARRVAGRSARRPRRPAAVDICLMPIARPRRERGNQPTTTRPDAELVLAAAAPPSSSMTPRPV